MILGTVTGTLFATRKNPHFEGKRILVVQPTDPRGPLGPPESLGARARPPILALDAAQAGVGDQVLVNREGSGARLIFGNDEIPVQAVIVAVVDHLDLREESSP